MTFTVNQEHLSDAIKVLKRHVDGRPSHPILACYLLELGDNFLKMTAAGKRGFSEALSRVTVEIPAVRQSEGEGEVAVAAVPFRWFGDVIGGLSKGCAISLSMKEVADAADKAKVSYLLELQTVTMSSSVECMDPDHFPVVCDPERIVAESMKVAKVSEEVSIGVPSQIMASVLKESLVAVSKDPYKEVLNAINLSASEGNNLQVAGTDGHRLVHAIYPEFKDFKGTEQVTIPYKVADSLSKLLGTNLKKLAKGGSSVVIRQEYKRVWEVGYDVNGTKVTFAFDECSGTYPNYLQLFPSSFMSTVTFNGGELKGVLSRIEKTANLTNGAVKLEFDGAIGKVAITAGNHKEEIAFEGTLDDKSGGKIAFNVNYLLDALKSDNFAIKDNGLVALGFNSPTTPAILTAGPVNPQNLNNPDSTYRYLIMPIQIRDL